MVEAATQSPRRDPAFRGREGVRPLQRRQVLDGLAASIVEKGYAASTIADIARNGRVSKSAVYEHFQDKEAAFLALHEEVVAQALLAVREAYEASVGEPDWEVRVRGLIAAYLRSMTADPFHMRIALVEAAAVSQSAFDARLAAFDLFVDAMVEMTAEVAAADPTAQPLSPTLALGAIGGVNEMVIRAAGKGPRAVLALEPVATDLLVRLIRAAPEKERR